MSGSGPREPRRLPDPLRRAFVDLGLFSGVVNVLLLTSPIYLLQVYDRVLSASSQETLLYLSLAAVLSLATLGVLEVVRGQYANRIAARLDANLGTQAFLDSLASGRARSGDLEPLRDLSILRSFAGSRSLLFLFDAPFAPLFLVILYFIHPLLCLLTTLGALVLFGLAIANQVTTARAAADAAASLASAMNLAQSMVRNFETIKPLGMISNATEAWGNRFAASLRASDRFTRINAFYGGVSRTLRMILQIAILGLGAYLVLDGDMTPGMIFAASLISSRALQPIDQIIGAWRQIADSLQAWRRLQRWTGQASPQPEHIALPRPRGELAVADLIYQAPVAAPGAPPIIRRVSFRLRPGESLAIIGPSGAGKTTLAQLLVGALQPAAGSVRLDGAELRNWDSDALGAHLGYLPQEFELFPGSIAQNIARLHPDAQDEQVIAAARWAGVHELILGMKDGYATQIGPEGVRLSGGERQRIALARAFFGDPRLLVLDEPNANLDAEGEAALSAGITGAKERGITLVVVTHKISIATQLDHILLLRQGQIELIGPSTEVLRRLNQLAPPVPAAQQPSLRSVDPPQNVSTS